VEGRFPPAKFFEAYPEAQRVGSGLFAKLLEASTKEVFRQIPEADCLEIYLWETPIAQ